MPIKQHISLKQYNTFGIDVKARYFAPFDSIQQLNELLEDAKTILENGHSPVLTLGGGSNILFTKDFDGLVLKNEISGIQKLSEDDEYVYIKAGAGENWHQFVLHCINHNWNGIENLSLIPGNVGASPMQNIGAYGVELKDLFDSLEAFHIQEKEVQQFNVKDCAFGYRDSVFKNKYRNQYVITSVTYKLSKKPKYNISYGAIEQELAKMGIKELSSKAISDAVIRIRSLKLPNPKEIGNAGSFFKNPEISQQEYNLLKEKYKDIVAYALPDNRVKLAAGWLIEQCGWKGYRVGDVGCHSLQALVLVNYGNASGNEIFNLSTEIMQSVKQKFDVNLEREVNII